MLRFFRQNRSLRFVLIISLLTAVAIGAALISAVAGQIGGYQLESLGSKAALGLALIIVLYIVPRLARTVKLEYLRSEFSLHIPNAGLLFLALILVVTILAMSSGNNLLYLVLAVLLATMFVSWVASRSSINRIKVAVRYPDHIFVGESVPFDVTVTNGKRLLPAFSIAAAMSEHYGTGSPRELAEVAYFPIVPAGACARMRIERSFIKRGVYSVRGFVLGTRFPFGFIEQRLFIETPGEIAVYPQPGHLDDFVQLIPLTNGRVETYLKGTGSDLYAIRRYLSSDHHHHIDWKATAKTTQLMVREFTSDDDWRVTIVFDTQVEGPVAAVPRFAEQFERAITLAATLINYFIEEGAEVRLVTAGEDSGFGIGKNHSYTMLRQLAQLTPEEGEDYHRLEETFSARRIGSDQIRILITMAARESIVAPLPHSTHIISIEEL
jgi:uncharacterized protein (DUF58 family)